MPRSAEGLNRDKTGQKVWRFNWAWLPAVAFGTVRIWLGYGPAAAVGCAGGGILLALLIGLRARYVGVSTDETGVEVTNYFGKRRRAWADVADFDYSCDRSWYGRHYFGHVILRDGGRLRISAMFGSKRGNAGRDGDHRASVAELRSDLARPH